MSDYKDRSSERHSPGLTTYVRAVAWLFSKYPFGYSHDLVLEGGEPYLERRILWLGGVTLRLHKFYKGDQDRAMHDHPWNFWTFPLSNYYEWVDKHQGHDSEWNIPGAERASNLVRRYRLHYRPATYRHIVMDPPGGKPIYTLVASGPRIRKWGFWVDGEFVYYRDYD
jgi:hypothetical protein